MVSLGGDIGMVILGWCHWVVTLGGYWGGDIWGGNIGWRYWGGDVEVVMLEW